MASANDRSDNILWFVAGAAVGAAVALLCAPQTGSDLRARLIKSTSEGRSALLDQGKQLFERGREMYEAGIHFAEEAAELFDSGRKLVDGGAAPGGQPGPAPGEAKA